MKMYRLDRKDERADGKVAEVERVKGVHVVDHTLAALFSKLKTVEVGRLGGEAPIKVTRHRATSWFQNFNNASFICRAL